MCRGFPAGRTRRSAPIRGPEPAAPRAALGWMAQAWVALKPSRSRSSPGLLPSWAYFGSRDWVRCRRGISRGILASNQTF